LAVELDGEFRLVLSEDPWDGICGAFFLSGES
jgi:hypothetical protein